jgi:transcriptional regulator of acetoin/glycerol metabolism
MDYPWPGNVRELENAVEHGFVLSNGQEIRLSDLPLELRQENRVAWEKTTPVRKALSRDQILELLDTCGWNKAEVGRRLGLSRTAVWKYMKKWDLPLKRPPATPSDSQ